jgi:hypothetical protein
VPEIGATVQLAGERYVVRDVSLGDFLRGDGSPIDGRVCVAVNVLTERELLGSSMFDPETVCIETFDEILAVIRAYIATKPGPLEAQLSEALLFVGRGAIAGACAKALRATVGAIEAGGLHTLASKLEAIEADGEARRGSS